MNKEFFPELKDALTQVRSLKHFNPLKNDPAFVFSLRREAKQIVESGYVVADFEFDKGDILQPGRYRIDLNRDEAREWMNAALSYMNEPRKYPTFADALPSELEELTCGHRPERYRKFIE